MPVLPFSLLVLHISVMVCMNYGCVCGFERKYCSSPRLLVPAEPSEGFKQERAGLVRWCRLAVPGPEAGFGGRGGGGAQVEGLLRGRQVVE